MRLGLELPPQQRVYGGFFIYSFCMGSLPPRLPDIQRAMGIEEGALGFGLIGAAAGTLIALSFAAPLLDRFGYRRSVLALIPLLALAYALASFATGPLAFFLLLVPAGLAIGGIEIILNLEADRTEHQLGHRIMNRAHAFWSFGFFSSGRPGRRIHCPKRAFPGATAPAAIMVPIVISRRFALILLGRYRARRRTGLAAVRPTRPRALPRLPPAVLILVLVSVCLSAMILEGAGIDWSAIYMRDDLPASAPFLGRFCSGTGRGRPGRDAVFRRSALSSAGARPWWRACLLAILGHRGADWSSSRRFDWLALCRVCP